MHEYKSLLFISFPPFINDFEESKSEATIFTAAFGGNQAWFPLSAELIAENAESKISLGF